MAKAKKKETLSLEEKLEQALVPADEQPYEVPENWCWVTVGNIVDLHRGVSYKKNEGHSVKEENDCLVMRGGNILEGAIDVEADNIYVDKSLIKTEQYVRENDIIIVSSTGSTKVIGRAGISYADYDDVSFGAFLTLVRPKEQINKRYVDYYFQSQIYRERIRSLASGVNINNIRTEYITNSPIPLPPLAEQQRIVEQIENLFAKLDEAKEKAQNVLESVEDRRLAILSEAFSGKLTTNWRNGNDFSADTVLLSDICTKITDGFHNSPKPVEEGYPYVMAGCVKEQGIDYYNGLFMDEKNHRELYNKAHPERGDILMVNIGAGSGTAAVIDVDFEFSFKNSAILKLKKDIVNPRYVLYYLWLRKKYLLIEVTRGGAQPFLSLKIINSISIPICSLEEQNEIVRIVDSLLESETTIREKQEKVIDSIDLLKKSILAKAFRGELGTNNLTEESSIELLKSILEK